MKKKLRLMMTMLLLAVMGSTWAAEVTTTYIFTSRDWTATCNGEEANWNRGTRASGYTSGQGIQITTSSSGANATSPVPFKNVKKIVVTYCTNSKTGKGTIKLSVGSGSEQTFNVTAPSSGGTTLKTKEFTYDPNETGSVNLTVDCATNSIYIYSIAITAETTESSTYSVYYECNGGESDCPDDISDVTSGSTITLPTAPTRANYTFGGWNDGTTTYQAGASYTVNSNVTFTAQWTENATSDEEWVLTNLADLTADDIFVIVGNNGTNYAMTNDKGTSTPPLANEVIVSDVDNKIKSLVPEKLKWNISIDDNGYTFHPNGSTSTWLYCTNSNDGVKVGTGNAKHFTLSDEGYLTTTETNEQRYLGIYNSNDWRCYTSINSNITGQTFAFYKRIVLNAVAKPVFSPIGGTYYEPQNVTITSGTEGASIYYTMDGSSPTTSSTPYSGAISVTETTTIKAIAVKEGMNNSDVASVTYTILALVDPTVQLMQERVYVSQTMQISYPDDLDITFISTDNTKATVSSTGLITGVSSGSVTISAIWNKGNGYNSGRQDFNITVVDATIYVKVTQKKQLVPGNEYILVAEESSVAMGKPYNNNKLRGYVNVIISNSKVASSDADLSVLILRGSTGAWTFQDGDGAYLEYHGSSNEVYVGTDPTQEACQWIITDDFQLQSKNVSGRYLRYNSGNPRFACYSSTSNQKKAYLYVKEGSPEGNFEAVEFTTAGYKTYVTENAIDWGKTLERNGDNVDVHAYQVTAFNNKNVTLPELGDGVITIAETPVIIKGKKGMNLLVIADEDGSDISNTNLLKKGSERSASEKDFMYVLQKSKQWKEDNPYVQYYFYPLNPTRWNEIGDRQAYLVLSSSPGGNDIGGETGGPAMGIPMRFIHANDDEPMVSDDAGLVDGINDIQRNEAIDGEFYSISGVRVAAPTKGLYIVNGKKVLVK